MKRLKLVVLLLASLFAAQAALATSGTWTSVTVSAVIPMTSHRSGVGSANLVEFQFSANSSTGATCASGNYNYGIVDISTAGGAYTAAVLQTARLAQTTVSVYGTGSCDSVFTSVEEIGYASY